MIKKFFRLALYQIMKKKGLDPSNLYMLRSNKKDSKDGSFKAFMKDPLFYKNSLLDYSRAYFLWQNIINLKHMQADIAECGTYLGGTAYMLAHLIQSEPNTVLHVFDTFEGMPPLLTEFDKHDVGDFSETSFEHVDKLLNMKNAQYKLYKGLFSNTFNDILGNTRFKFVHCDADIYNSVFEVSKFFYDRLIPGGIMIYDDYGWATTPGAQRAVLDFFKDKPEHPIYIPSRQAFIVKQ